MGSYAPEVLSAGLSLDEAQKAILLIHGKEGTAKSMLGIQRILPLQGLAILALQAPSNSWYPQPFIAPREQNEACIGIALDFIHQQFQQLQIAGIKTENSYLLGFSQGACLALEYLYTYPKLYAGAFILSGGLFGEKLEYDRYQGDLKQTPIFLGCSEKDVHIPLARVKESGEIGRKMNASLSLEISPSAQHSIKKSEIQYISRQLTK